MNKFAAFLRDAGISPLIKLPLTSVRCYTRYFTISNYTKEVRCFLRVLCISY